MKVNKITSTKTQLPYEYYSLDYCKPGKIINSAENLGEVLRGDRIENSPYIVCYKFYSLQILMASVSGTVMAFCEWFLTKYVSVPSILLSDETY